VVGYREQIVVLKSQWHITLVGAGREVTKITSRQSAGTTGTTYTTSTVGISASYFTAKNITFEVIILMQITLSTRLVISVFFLSFWQICKVGGQEGEVGKFRFPPIIWSLVRTYSALNMATSDFCFFSLQELRNAHLLDVNDSMT
jgi:hypothetical protein